MTLFQLTVYIELILFTFWTLPILLSSDAKYWFLYNLRHRHGATWIGTVIAWTSLLAVSHLFVVIAIKLA